MAAKKGSSKSQPSKTTEPRRYAEVRLETIEKKLLAAQAAIPGILADVAELKQLLAPPAEEEKEKPD